MNRIRLARPDEVESIREQSDITNDSIMLALDTQAGTPIAVIRPVIEVDPVNFPESFPDKLKVIFMRDIETYLMAKGIGAYYFNIHANDSMKPWRDVSTTWGAKEISTEPEIRYKKVL